MTGRPPFLPIYSHEADIWKGYNFSMEDTRKGYLLSKIVYIRIRDWTSGRSLSANKVLLSSRGPRTVQRAYWKRGEQEKQWGEGVQSESRRNSYNGTFDQKLLPDPSGIPDSGKLYEWFILTALVNIQRSITLWKCEVTAMRSSVTRFTFKKVLRPLALLAALLPKMPAPYADSTTVGDKNYCKFYSKRYPLPAVRPYA